MALIDVFEKPSEDPGYAYSAKPTADITDVTLAYTFGTDETTARVANSGEFFLGVPRERNKASRVTKFVRGGWLRGRAAELLEAGDRISLADGGKWQADVNGLYVVVVAPTAADKPFTFTRI